MPFISSSQQQLLFARIDEAVGPEDGGKSAKLISKAITDWFEQDVLPQLIVPPGISSVGSPGNVTSVSPGQVK